MRIIVKENMLREDYYDAKLSKEERLKNPYYFSGRNIEWFGKDNMCVFHKSIAEYMPENLWNSDKLDYLEDLIDSSEDKIQLSCDYATLNIITVQDIIEHQESVLGDEFEINFDGIDEPESSGDDELDAFLGATDEDMFEENLEKMGLDDLNFLDEPERFVEILFQLGKNKADPSKVFDLYKKTSIEDYDDKGYNDDHLKWINQSIKHLSNLISSYNELKDYEDLKVVIRDGNHRIKAAIQSGEEWVCANINKNELNTYSNIVSKSRYINKVTQTIK